MLGIEILKRMGGGAGAGPGEVTLVSAFVSGNGWAQWHINPNRFTSRTDDTLVIDDPEVTLLDRWLPESLNAIDYEARATLQSGNTPPGGIGTWQNCNVAVGWGWSNSTTFRTCQLLVQVRLAATGVIQDACIVNIEANGMF